MLKWKVKGELILSIYYAQLQHVSLVKKNGKEIRVFDINY